MENDTINPVVILKGLALLTAIPVVAMALWGEYFWRYIEEIKEEPSEIEPQDEIQKIRLATLVALMLQMFLFLAATEIRKIYPLITTGLFTTVTFIHLWQQSSMEQRLKACFKSNIETTRPLLQAVRTFFWVTVPGLIYVGIVVFSVTFFIALAQVSHLQAPWNITLILAGLSVGVLGGLATSFALGPIQIRKMFPSAPLSDDVIRTEIESHFKERALNIPGLWTIHLQGVQSHNVMIAGFKGGQGILRPALFISEPLLGLLTPAELKAIILHEIAHIQLNHLKNRFLLSAGLILSSSILAGALALLCHFIFPGSSISSWVALITLMICFGAAIKAIEHQGILHEVEADIHAVTSGARIEDLESALYKLDELNQVNPRGTHLLHTESRIRILRDHFSSKTHQNLGSESKTRNAA